jgi:ATP-dependent Clp protease ATP-binding subunit ClpA
MFERFSEGARAVVVVAREQAVALGHDSIGTQHLLLGLLSPETGAASQVLHDVGLQSDLVRGLVRRHTPADGYLTEEDADSLRTLGIDLDVVLAHLEASFGPEAVPRSEPRRGRVGMSRPAKKTLQLALREAIWLRAAAIGSEHILLGLLRCDDTDINAILAETGIKPDDLRAATLRAIGRAA